MKTQLILVIIISTLTVFARHQNKSVSKALQDLVEHLFVRRGLPFEILIVGELSISSSDVLGDFLKDFQDNHTLITIKNVNQPQLNVKEELSRTALIFSDSNSLQHFQRKPLTHSPFSYFGYVFYVDDEKINLTSLATIPDVREGTTSHYAYFLVNHKESYELKTFEWWTETACNQLQILTLNSFYKSTSKWRQELKIQEKFLNFHNCSIKNNAQFFTVNIADLLNVLGIFEFPPYFPLMFNLFEKKDMEIVKIFAEQGNMTADRIPLEARQGHRENGAYFFQPHPFNHRLNNRYCTHAFMDQDITAVYSLPEPYTAYEKMVLPFDADTWMYLIITFAVAFFSIFLMNFLPSVVKDIIYGKGVKVPSFNVIGTFFGIGQTRLPDNNFARIVLMGFILFCLIFRTAYQGVFFEMMTSDMRRSPPMSFLDLKVKNYTLLVPEFEDMKLQINELVLEEERPLTKPTPFTELYDTVRQLSNASLKTAVALSKIDYKVATSAFDNVKVIEDSKYLTGYGTCIWRNNYATKITENVMTYLTKGGIPQHFFDYLLNYEFELVLKPYKEESGPKVFSIGDLEFGFIIWLAACGISICAFLLEILWYFVRVKLSNFLKNFAFLFIIFNLRDKILRLY